MRYRVLGGTGEVSAIAKHPAFTQSIIALSTFKYKLKNFLLYAAIFLGMNTPVFAEKFTNADFLQLPDEAKKFWIIGAIEVLVFTAASKNPDAGQCVYDWYFADKAKSNGVILGYAEKYPNNTITSILFAVLENECGKIRS